MISAIFVTNLLANEVCAAEKGTPPPPFDIEYVQELGAAALLPEWRKIATAEHSRQDHLVGKIPAVHYLDSNSRTPPYRLSPFRCYHANRVYSPFHDRHGARTR